MEKKPDQEENREDKEEGKGQQEESREEPQETEPQNLLAGEDFDPKKNAEEFRREDPEPKSPLRRPIRKPTRRNPPVQKRAADPFVSKRDPLTKRTRVMHESQWKAYEDVIGDFAEAERQTEGMTMPEKMAWLLEKVREKEKARQRKTGEADASKAGHPKKDTPRGHRDEKTPDQRDTAPSKQDEGTKKEIEPQGQPATTRTGTKRGDREEVVQKPEADAKQAPAKKDQKQEDKGSAPQQNIASVLMLLAVVMRDMVSKLDRIAETSVAMLAVLNAINDKKGGWQ